MFRVNACIQENPAYLPILFCLACFYISSLSSRLLLSKTKFYISSLLNSFFVVINNNSECELKCTALFKQKGALTLIRLFQNTLLLVMCRTSFLHISHMWRTWFQFSVECLLWLQKNVWTIVWKLMYELLWELKLLRK